MKRVLSIFFISAILLGCKSSNNTNPYLKDVTFDITLNLNLPEYSSLKYPGNALYVAEGGIKGIIVFNTGSGYNAFEASDPNHYPNDCSTMEVDGTTAVCPCENNRYSLSDGHLMEGEGDYGMKPYHIIDEGDVLHIYN